MKQILIAPSWGTWLENRLFSGAEGCVYTEAFKLWRELAQQNGFALDTWDMKPLAQADCVWVMDLPRQRTEFEQAKQRARAGVPFVLQVLESPVITPQSFVAENRRCFDAVVSYEQGLKEQQKSFSYCLPNSIPSVIPNHPFEQRRCAVMINTNRVEGYFAMRQAGRAGLPGIGRHLSGWHLPWQHLLAPATGELYSWRRGLAQAADQLDVEVLDVFGSGWQGEQISWFPFFPHRTYRCARGKFQSQKQTLVSGYRFVISVENFRGDLGYISEKFFDALLAGAVPVYLGEERITDYIPSAAFVDVREFRNQTELLKYLHSCPKAEWEGLQSAGRSFLHSPAFTPFSDQFFASRMTSILEYICEKR